MEQNKQTIGIFGRLLGERTLVIVALFTLLDCLAGFLYWLHTEQVLPSRFFNLSRDRGCGEIVQYAKYGMLIYILHRMFTIRRETVYKAWYIFFIALLLDDSLGLHEFIGKVLAGVTPFDLPRKKQIFEIVGFALIEGAALCFVFITFFWASREARRYSILLFFSLWPLIIAGIVLDSLPFELSEQVGEMIGATIVLCFVHWHFRSAFLTGDSAQLRVEPLLPGQSSEEVSSEVDHVAAIDR